MTDTRTRAFRSQCPACGAWPFIGRHTSSGCASTHGGEQACGCRYEAPEGLLPSTDFCAAKLGEPGPRGMQVCGKPVIYLVPAVDGVHYEGWRHLHVGAWGHGAVPARMVR